MAKRAARYHAQLLIEAPERAPLHRLLASGCRSVEDAEEPARPALVAGRGSARTVLAFSSLQARV